MPATNKNYSCHIKKLKAVAFSYGVHITPYYAIRYILIASGADTRTCIHAHTQTQTHTNTHTEICTEIIVRNPGV